MTNIITMGTNKTKKTNLYISIPVILSLIIVMSSINVSAFVPIKEYKGIRYKIYDEKRIDENLILSWINDIGSEQFENITIIKAFAIPRDGVIADYHYWSKVINIYGGGYNLEVIKHELCHNYQEEKGDDLLTAVKHEGYFKECIEE